MALYDTRFGLPQTVADYLNQGLPSIQQPYRPGYDKNYGPGEGMAYTTVMPQPGYQYVYGPDGQRYSIPISGYNPNEDADIDDPAINPIEKLSVSGGNEEGFSVYNPDPNMTRTSRNYVNPFPYDPMDDFGTPDYGYVEQPRKGIPGLFDQYVKTSIPAQLIGGGVKGLLNMLPVNRTGIMQNELLGAGFALDNIGRIVAAPGKYNTPEGIMAGYNLAAREQDFADPKNVFNKRDTNIRNTLKNKYKLDDQQIDQVLSEIEEEGEYKGPFGYNETLGKTTNLFENLFNINKARNIIEDKQRGTDIIFNRKVKERKEKALEKQNQERIARETRQKAEAARKNQTYTGGSDRQNVVDRNTGRRDATGGDRGSRGASDQFSNRSGRGRTGY